MNLTILEEPELEFGGGNRHVDIRFGIRDYGPFDLQSSRAPKEVRVGLIGTTETVEGTTRWLEKCSQGVAQKQTKQPNLFPAFPPISSTSSFCCAFVADASLARTLTNTSLETVSNEATIADRVERAVDLFIKEVEFLAENSNPDVIVCALPVEVLEMVYEERKSPGRKDLHHLLKARTMQWRIPIQLILPSTYDESKARKLKRTGIPRPLQDEATRAWNIFSALYYKAGGTPWRLVRDSSQFSACFVGISFFESLDRSRLTTSMAQVFNELGEGVVVRGGSASLSKDDRQPHLSGDDCQALITDALAKYRDVHRTLPARVVIHKSSPFSQEEEAGARKAIKEARIDIYDLVHVNDSEIRLYRDGVYPPLRGTFLQTSGRSGVLYTKGSVPFFETYPGMYVPKPVSIKIAAGDQTPLGHAKEILALTKMNWNSTQFDGGMPLTLTAAQSVGNVLKHCQDNQRIEPRYCFYM
ncbi:argonaute/piwi family protein [Occallatibacter riparius]|uniref:Protein argonaute n=1 Tax=Occallatibacter riparius TaxID=1002689 RepID=A0A9J7BHC4_9BACT|nr:hypothetical protein [Occallatibacter riparius]UWZ81811.1 hypothetical protein MOP44_14585 [Occallatibacter riparius]